MKKKNLQSRREFFKNAAKGVLPILGVVVLGGIPKLIKAEQGLSRFLVGVILHYKVRNVSFAV